MLYLGGEEGCGPLATDRDYLGTKAAGSYFSFSFIESTVLLVYFVPLAGP